MLKYAVTLIFLQLVFATCLRANNCNYWLSKIDAKTEVDFDIDERKTNNIMTGIQCLLEQQGNKKEGLLYGSKEHVSQFVPKASVEVDSLYYISYLFYGHFEFANAVALVGQDKKFNSTNTIKQAYKSYRCWYLKVKEIGLEEARKQKLDPLNGSGVRWY